MRTYAIAGLLVLLAETTVASAEPAQEKTLHWTIEGERRDAIVIFPDSPRNQPAPLVFVFHGHGSTMEKFARKMPIEDFWPEAVAVYMQGLPTASRVDPKGRHAGWQSQLGTERNRDLKFLDAVLKTLRERHAIDNDREKAGRVIGTPIHCACWQLGLSPKWQSRKFPAGSC
jgi:polyhydroxybutyrate depolymerase